MRVQFLKFPSDRVKPGGSLTNFDFELIESLVMHFSYRVIFKEQEIVAGNHYHGQRQELIICMFGNVLAAVEDPETREREMKESWLMMLKILIMLFSFPQALLMQ